MMAVEKQNKDEQAAEEQKATSEQTPGNNLEMPSQETPAEETPPEAKEEPLTEEETPTEGTMAEKLAELEQLREENERLKAQNPGDADLDGKINAAIAKAMSAMPQSEEVLTDVQKQLKDIEEDTLKTPVMFFAHSFRKSDLGYTGTNGKEVRPPNDEMTVLFTPWKRYNRQVGSGVRGRGIETVSICKYSTRSKAMVEYLMSHPDFNITFFLSPKDAQEVKIHLVDIMQANAQRVKQMSDNGVVAKCKELNLPISGDLISMRKVLIEKMAEKEVARIDKQNKDAAERWASSSRDNPQFVDTPDGLLSDEARAILNG
jgi:hypothetical protein